MLTLVLMFLSFATPNDTTRIQRLIDRCSAGGTVKLPAGTIHVSTLQLKSDCSYMGADAGTTLVLLDKNRFVMDLSERSNIRISGITFDGNGRGGALLMQNNAPVRGIRIDHCRFTNVVSAATYPANLTIYSSWGIIDSSITNNQFSNVSGGIFLTTVQNVTISDNTFKDVTQSDAVFIAPNPVSFPSGDNLRITNNTGDGLAKMGIEIFRPDPPNGSHLESPVIEDNHFSRFTATDGEGMGLSITHGENAIVRGNVIDNTMGRHQENGIGIEIIVRGARVSNNSVTGGFGYGIAVQGTPEAQIDNNTISNVRKVGILFACDGGRNRCDSSRSRVEKNDIRGTTLAGIQFQGRWTGSRVVNNDIAPQGGQAILESVKRDNSIVEGNVTSGEAKGR